MIRDSSHQYAQEKLLPRITEANRKGTFDRDIIKEMGRTLKISFLEPYGGVTHITFFDIIAFWCFDARQVNFGYSVRPLTLSL